MPNLSFELMKMGIFLTMKLCYLFLVLSSVTCIYIAPSNSSNCLSMRWFVRIHDGIQNSTISVHVRSKDDDLGFHNITYEDEYGFRFCENAFQNTVFGGDFSYGNKFVHFDVFNRKIADLIGGIITKVNPVNWLLKEDGYYVAKNLKAYDDPSWIKRGDW